MDLEPRGNPRQPENHQSGDGINELDLELFRYNPLETIIVDRSGRVVDYNLAKKASGSRLPRRGDVMYRDYAAKHEFDMHTELMRCIERSESKTFPAIRYHHKYLHITISPFPKGAIIVSQNVTDQTVAEEALRKSEERYRNLFDRVPAGLYRASATGRFLDVNQALVQMLGFPDRDSLLAINVADMYVHPEEFKGTMDRLDREATLRNAESRFYRFDGTTIWIKTSARAVRDEKNRIETLEGAVEDITERKLAEEALQKSEKEKALILSSVLELVTYQDLSHRIIWANRQTEETFGVGPGDLVGRKCHEVWQGNGNPCAQCPMRKILDTGSPQVAEKTTPDGRVWATRGYPVRNDAGEIRGLVEVNLDITGQKRVEEEKQKIQAQLLQAQKMEAVGTLAGGVAHDFNNLLTAIQGCLDLAMLKIPEDGPVYKDLLEVQTASRRAADLTRQLLLFSRRHLTRLVPLQLNATVEDLLKMLHRLIGEDIEINTQPDPNLWNILADKGTGLGLSVVYGIVKQHNGWINVYSEPGQGSEFKIYFPAVFTHAGENRSVSVDPGNLRGSGERILVVEDEPMVRDFSRRALDKHGYRVCAVSTVQEALSAFEAEGGPVRHGFHRRRASRR